MIHKKNILKILTQLSLSIDQLIEHTGKLISWLVLLLILLVNYDVAMRYFFLSGSIAIQELQWHIFALIFLIGSAYTLKNNQHIRLDLLYNHTFKRHHRAWVDLLGGLLFLIPFCLLVSFTATNFAIQSFTHMESSPDPGGLPFRWLLKASIPVGFCFLALQGLSEIIKSLNIILEEKT